MYHAPIGSEVYTQATDRKALLALFKTTGGAGWREKTGWAENSDDLATWFGVTLNTSRRVNAVDVNGNNLDGECKACLIIVS